MYSKQTKNLEQTQMWSDVPTAGSIGLTFILMYDLSTVASAC